MNIHCLFTQRNGIVVLHATFPSENTQNMTDKDLMKLLFSSERGYPYLTTMMESTLAALDLVVTRGFVDEKRVGIGGLSQGSQNPLYMLAKSNRIAPRQCRRVHGVRGSTTPRRRRGPAEIRRMVSGSSWRRVEVVGFDRVAHNKQSIRADSFNFSDQEVFNSTTLLRHLEDEHKPFDAYVFPGEYHEKWQPAHRAAIYSRNLDWFRFGSKAKKIPTPPKPSNTNVGANCAICTKKDQMRARSK